MTFTPNPFFVGKPVPPEKFIGRKRYLDEAFDLIEQRGHTAISGADGMGKTSLLKYLESPQCWELQGYLFKLFRNYSICSDFILARNY